MTERMSIDEYRRHVRSTDEDAFRRAVQRYAAHNGWLYWHPPVSTIRDRHMTATEGHAGFPDTVFARNGVVVMVEFKTTKGRLTEKQRDWLAAMSGVLPSSIGKGFSHHDGPLAVAVWTPDNWPIIETVLGPSEAGG